jgi:CheY-like chemotaxis protein
MPQEATLDLHKTDIRDKEGGMSEELLFLDEISSETVLTNETPTALVVGDAPEENSRTRRVLERYCFRVLTVPSIQQALDIISKETVIVIIADALFEGASGIDFLRRAMSIDAKPRRILIGSPEAALLAAAINQGWLFACLPRPFDSRALSQTAIRASEAYANKEEQRRLIDDLTARIQVLEAELRNLTQKTPLPETVGEYRFSNTETFESARAIPVKFFGDLPPKPFQSVMPPAASEPITERELVAITAPVESFANAPKTSTKFQEQTQLAVMRLVAGLSAGSPPEETAWGLAALVILGQDTAAGVAARRAASRLTGLAGSGRGGSIAAWALSERFARTQNPSDRALAEAALAWVSLPSTTTPDLAAASSLLALVAGASAGLSEEIGAAERLRNIISRFSLSPQLKGDQALLITCIAALSGRDVTPAAHLLAAMQRQFGGLAGEVDHINTPPLIATAMAAIIFGASQLQGAVVSVLRQSSPTR